ERALVGDRRERSREVSPRDLKRSLIGRTFPWSRERVGSLEPDPLPSPRATARACIQEPEWTSSKLPPRCPPSGDFRIVRSIPRPSSEYSKPPTWRPPARTRSLGNS